MLATDLNILVRIAAVVLPVAVYFGVLGLLNTRRRPQLLSGRQDSTLLIVALSPLFAVPAVNLVGGAPWALIAVVAAIAAVVVLAGRGDSWVIYNISADQARDVVAGALQRLGAGFCADTNGFRLDSGGRIRISSFSLLRNVSIRLDGVDVKFNGRFVAAMSRRLALCTAEASPMAVSMLLVAIAMMVAPLAMMAPQVPEIVRALTNLLP